MRCGTPLAPAALPSDERRIVSILFADLVGFTERSDLADPEDVRRTLVPFHERVKAVIERFGGTLDKFIGDEAMGVFGAPVAHEDDPVRAVEAALAILDEMVVLRRQDPDLAVRIAVNTGEAVVSFGTGPQVGEAVAGDVVNTASRMQGLAPRDGVLIGPATVRAVAGRFDLEAMEPVRVKGKAAPLATWLVRGRRAEDASEKPTTSFVGRDSELLVLADAYEDVLRTHGARAVLVVGEPGVGKTRLVRELAERLDGRADTPRWLATRCAAYGEEAPSAPLGRLLRSSMSLGESDESSDVRARVESRLPATLGDAEREGVRASLLQVLGVDAAVPERPTTTRDVAAAAAVVLRGQDGSSVVAVEDLHWSEPPLREMLRALVVELEDAPVLFVGTARTELHPADAFGGSATVVQLHPLDPERVEELVEQVTERLGVRDVDPAVVAGRSGGNPLFALEFVRALADEPVRGRVASVPDSVQAVIAARLDAVPLELRAVVQDAAVVGDEFWVPAIALVGGRREPETTLALEALARRGVVVEGSPTWFSGLSTYRFSHALFREVEYERLPRSERAKKHRLAGTWIEEASGPRATERSEILAYHFERAVLVGEMAGSSELAEAARPAAARWLLAASERAAWLDARDAFERFERLLRIAPARGVERARALAGTASMGRRAGLLDVREGLRRVEEAIDIARSLDDPSELARTLIRRFVLLAWAGEAERGRQSLDDAIRILDRLPPTGELSRAYAFRAEDEMMLGRAKESLDWADRAYELARRTDERSVAIMALHLRGNARCELGLTGALEDLDEALRLSESSGNATDIVYSRAYLAEWSWLLSGPAAGLAHSNVGIDLAARRGLVGQQQWGVGTSLAILWDDGNWDELERRAGWLSDTDPGLIDPTLRVAADIWRSKVALARGRLADTADPADISERARAIGELHALGPGLAVASMIALARDDAAAALAYVSEWDDATRDVSAVYREEGLDDAVRTLVAIGERELAASLIPTVGTTMRARSAIATATAVVVESRGDHATAVDRYREAVGSWSSFGAPYEWALALAGRARSLEALGENASAERQRATTLLTGLGAVGPPPA
jgi:class 3 adenylate cyclase/tetratricopeptide (TPR) repeat protein